MTRKVTHLIEKKKAQEEHRSSCAIIFYAFTSTVTGMPGIYHKIKEESKHSKKQESQTPPDLIGGRNGLIPYTFGNTYDEGN